MTSLSVGEDMSLASYSKTSSHISQRAYQARKSYGNDAVSVKNLSMCLCAAFDIWGRPKPQPAMISVTVGLAQPFSSAASTDTVNASTIHYGQLSKAITREMHNHENDNWLSPSDLIWLVALTVKDVPASPTTISTVEGEISFPKATRYGEGVDMLFYQDYITASICMTLHIKRLHVGALVGVNSHERDMKQMLIVSVWIDRASEGILGNHNELEQLCVKTVEESSYETLESLAEELAARAVKYFILPVQTAPHEAAGIRIRIEKPSAVPFADAPAVEIYRQAETSSEFGKRMIVELGGKRPRVPFPLQGRLDEFLNSWKQD